jgi:hypothetical protein
MVSITISAPCQTTKNKKNTIFGTWYLTKRESNSSVQKFQIWNVDNATEFLTLSEDYYEFNLRNSGVEQETGFQIQIDEKNNEILDFPYFLSQDTTCRGVTNHLVSYSKKGDTLILFNFNEYYDKKKEASQKEYYLPYPKSIPLLTPSIDDEKW